LYVVELGDLSASPIAITVNGQPYQVTIEPDDLHSAPVVAPEVAVQPRRPQVPPRPATSRLAAAAADASVGTQVRAPMPGTILGIAVTAGDPVMLRQTLCSLEAMKMRNAIRAPRDGVISAVEVTEGQIVPHGHLLFTLE
jgi:biotin carboxyl carrier protein